MIATAVTAVATTWAIIQNNHNRPRPAWVIDSAYFGSVEVGAGSKRAVRVTVTNIGDGAAFHASASFTGVEVTPGWEHGTPPEAKVEPGGSFAAGLRVKHSGSNEFDETVLDYVDTRVTEWPPNPRVRVEWREPPRRDKQRSKTFKVPHPQRDKR